MEKIKILFCLFVLGIITSQAQDVKKLLEKVTPEQLQSYIDLFRGEPIKENQSGYAERMARLANLTKNHFSALGLRTEKDSSNNVIAVQTGTYSNARNIIISAHYKPRPTVTDSGLDDNASGMGALFLISKILQDLRLSQNIIFAAFSDYCGAPYPSSSKNWMAGHRSDLSKLLVVFNMDSIGAFNNTPGSGAFSPPVTAIFPDASADVKSEDNRGNYIFVIAGNNSRSYANFMKTEGKIYVPGFHVVPTVYAGSGAMLCEKFPPFCLSDHGNFWSSGYPALHISDMARNSPFNIKFAVNVTKTVLASVIDIGY